MDPQAYNLAQKKQKGSWNKCYTTLAFLAVCFGTWFLFLRQPTADIPSVVTTKAIVVLGGDSKVSGTVTFTQKAAGLPVTISGDLRGLDSNAKRGFHVHELGDATNACLSSGSHFNPFGRPHGAPSDSLTSRHVGDLGNIESDSNGTAKFTFTDSLISLNGANSIVGRSVVVHAGTDDLGRGDNDESAKTGNAGGRAACGVIGIAA